MVRSLWGDGWREKATREKGGLEIRKLGCLPVAPQDEAGLTTTFQT